MTELASALTALETVSGLSEFLLRTRRAIPADTVELLRQLMARTGRALDAYSAVEPAAITDRSDEQIDMFADEYQSLAG